MKCNFEWLSAYLDGALAEDRRAKLEEHLKTCEACTAKLEEFARVEQTAKKIPAPQLSEAYWENFANRVQNKLTIREKQKTSPGWLEALKGLFQPTTGKLAIAGSVAVILLLTFISLDQWKKETFRPPVFEAEPPMMDGKVDSVQVLKKDESEFRTAEKDNKVGLVEDKRLDQPARERGTTTLSQKPAENVPAASAPVGRTLAAPEEQKSKEEPSLGAFAKLDEPIKEDTSLVIAGKKVEETEKAFLQSRSNLQKRSLVASPTKGQPQDNDANDTIASSVGIDSNASTVAENASSMLVTKENIEDFKRVMRIIDTTYAREEIKEFENELKKQIPQFRAESIYVFIGSNYLNLCYNTLLEKGWNTALEKDWNTANRRVNDFLKKELSDYTRQQLLQIQTRLKKLKK